MNSPPDGAVSRPPARTRYADIATALAPHGLLARGGFRPAPEDGLSGVAALVLVGNAGNAMWRAFASARRSGEIEAGSRDPLDRWTRWVVEAAARRLGADALFPFGGPPWHPFQRWAMRAEPVAPSPLGLLIHPEYGLWHAYRGALAFTTEIDLPANEARPSPCEGCADRPCLAACPVGAFTGRGYDVGACADHIAAPAGRDCMARGCLARHACPVGRAHAQEPAQAAFHMSAFLRARRWPGSRP